MFRRYLWHAGHKWAQCAKGAPRHPLNLVTQGVGSGKAFGLGALEGTAAFSAASVERCKLPQAGLS